MQNGVRTYARVQAPSKYKMKRKKWSSKKLLQIFNFFKLAFLPTSANSATTGGSKMKKKEWEKIWAAASILVWWGLQRENFLNPIFSAQIFIKLLPHPCHLSKNQDRFQAEDAREKLKFLFRLIMVSVMTLIACGADGRLRRGKF